MQSLTLEARTKYLLIQKISQINIRRCLIMFQSKAVSHPAEVTVSNHSIDSQSLQKKPLENPIIETSHTNLVTVVLIDDQPFIGEAVRRILETETDIAFNYISDPTQAIQRAIALAPTVILLDMVMPEVDGLMLLRWFRSHPATCDVPIIMLSNKEEAKLKARTFTDGANDYLIKLPDAVELIARIRYHSRAYNNFKALNQAAATAQLQVQLIQTEKMSSLKRMVAGVAHEVNNPVNFIHGNLNHLHNHVESILNLIKLYQQEYPQPTPVIQEEAENINFDFIIEDLSKIVSSMKLGTERIRDIVKSLRNFSRLDEADKKLVSIDDGIESTLLILSPRLKSGIKIIKEYGDLPLIECYPAKLNQVFMNIISNAIDVLLDNPEQTEKIIIIKTIKTDDQKVNIRIQDNGCGMNAEIKGKIFDPFFTTKPVNQGTGLGLTISYQIIKKHRGKIEVKSESGYGTEFIIEIPITLNNVR
ncbi:histidine kinase [Mastigocoleus testarum BC008]|uniref:histidine kinase n=2 Tax=Mastigocoleus TaxID=996924 RepID=A0A0V7ZV22_9CYAN|nr:histidine kinase [Mastigocoleus testarum BC008]KST68311.1 histidine kinase [Mastigocoleus testarum BC008]